MPSLRNRSDMRVYISVDMEGVAGVVHEHQTDPSDPRHAVEYARSCRLITGEANAAVAGAFAAGATAAFTAELVPGFDRVGGRTMRYRHANYREAFRGWRAMYNLAAFE